MTDNEKPDTASPSSGNTPNRKVIEGYGPGRFRISGAIYEGSVIVLPEQVIALPVTAFQDLTLAHLAPVLDPAAGVELLLLGCGARMAMVATEMRTALRAAGIGVEPMDSGAAARTHNVLLSENRRVATVLIALPGD